MLRAQAPEASRFSDQKRFFASVALRLRMTTVRSNIDRPLGAYDYIMKPFDVAVFKEVIDRAVEFGQRSRTWNAEPPKK